MCLSIDSRSRLFVLPSPSSFPMRDFISALSICQALRSRSCLCHSVCRKRMTPAMKEGSAEKFESSTDDDAYFMVYADLVTYTLCLEAALHYDLPRSHRRHSLRCPPCQRSSARPLSPRLSQPHNHWRIPN